MNLRKQLLYGRSNRLPEKHFLRNARHSYLHKVWLQYTHEYYIEELVVPKPFKVLTAIFVKLETNELVYKKFQVGNLKNEIDISYF